MTAAELDREIPKGNKGVRLLPEDLRNFDDEATRLILRAQTVGWRGHITNRGHAFMYAPDGVATMSVSRESTHAKSGKNAKATLERWLRKHAEEQRAKAGLAFGLGNRPEPDVMFEEVGGRPVPVAMLAEMKRSQPLIEFWGSEGYMNRPDREDSTVVAATVRPDEIEANPRTWYVMDVGVVPPVLIAHGSHTNETDVWATFLADFPQYASPFMPAEQQVEENEMKKYVCKECGMEFEHPQALGVHVQTHLPPRVCEICGREFKNQGALNLHMAHHSEAVLTCEICGWSTKNAGAFGLHKTRKHPELDPYYIPPVGVTTRDVPETSPVSVANQIAAVEAVVAQDVPVTSPPAAGVLTDSEIVAQFRSVLAAPLLEEVAALRAENAALRETNAKLEQQQQEWEAWYQMIRP